MLENEDCEAPTQIVQKPDQVKKSWGREGFY